MTDKMNETNDSQKKLDEILAIPVIQETTSGLFLLFSL